ncbi:sorting nexin-6-like [Haliotis rufescens]|uniref:sorting nexin-6-like n=1 Tax=Haliotis rufescens TaxID=6454 RepID=UPI001EB01065|nr:sorting nexin-6-like [Haliotis rufescens]
MTQKYENNNLALCHSFRHVTKAAAMMDGIDDSPDLLAEDHGNKGRSDTVDLTDTSLLVDISDALSERDKVKFTVHTKTTLQQFRNPEFSVVRQHEEFIWLHDRYGENEEYAGIIIPPAPPKPDFDASREKLQRLGEGEGTMTREEFTKMKQELEAEYLATFKKTVAMHEVFLQRLAAHPALRNDVNFEVFLEFDGDLSVRGKNKREKLGGFFRTITKSADEVLLSSQKDVDDFFEAEKVFLVDYHVKIKDSTGKSDRMTRTHKNVADTYIQISSGLVQLATIENTELNKIFTKVAEALEKARKLEGRVASDEDLKLSDTLRYYMRDSSAAKDLLYRRTRSLADYEAANKALEKARTKNKEVQQAEKTQEICCKKFEKISEMAKKELTEFKTRRIAYFRKNMVDLAELEMKHAKAQVQLLKNCITALKEEAQC